MITYTDFHSTNYVARKKEVDGWFEQSVGQGCPPDCLRQAKFLHNKICRGSYRLQIPSSETTMAGRCVMMKTINTLCAILQTQLRSRAVTSVAKVRLIAT